jgi:hypothetical protein
VRAVAYQLNRLFPKKRRASQPQAGKRQGALRQYVTPRGVRVEPARAGHIAWEGSVENGFGQVSFAEAAGRSAQRQACTAREG